MAELDDVIEVVPVDRFDWERAVRNDDDILGNRLLVLLVLGTYMDKDGGNAKPSLETLGSKCGLHPATVGRHLNWARDAGYLHQVSRGHRRGDGIGVASIHRATILMSLPRIESDVECDVEVLNRANGHSQPRNQTSQPRIECAPTTVFDIPRSSTTTAQCARCGGDGMYKREDGVVMVCDHRMTA